MKVLKFGAIWCKECIVMRPMWSEIENQFPGLESQYFDADENIEDLNNYNVKDIPSFIFLDKNNVEFKRLKGVQNKEDLIKIIEENLNK